jgi:hypothetical protein
MYAFIQEKYISSYSELNLLRAAFKARPEKQATGVA